MYHTIALIRQPHLRGWRAATHEGGLEKPPRRVGAGHVGDTRSNHAVGRIIGGGPAGSFFTLHAFKYARPAGQQVAVTIYECKGFSRLDPARPVATCAPACSRPTSSVSSPNSTWRYWTGHARRIRHCALHTWARTSEATPPDTSAEVFSVPWPGSVIDGAPSCHRTRTSAPVLRWATAKSCQSNPWERIEGAERRICTGTVKELGRLEGFNAARPGPTVPSLIPAAVCDRYSPVLQRSTSCYRLNQAG